MDDDLAQIRADATDVVVRLLEEIDRLRDELAQARDTHRLDLAELDAYRSASVEEIGQRRLASLLGEIKRLRGSVGDRGSRRGAADV